MKARPLARPANTNAGPLLNASLPLLRHCSTTTSACATTTMACAAMSDCSCVFPLRRGLGQGCAGVRTGGGGPAAAVAGRGVGGGAGALPPLSLLPLLTAQASAGMLRASGDGPAATRLLGRSPSPPCAKAGVARYLGLQGAGEARARGRRAPNSPDRKGPGGLLPLSVCVRAQATDRSHTASFTTHRPGGAPWGHLGSGPKALCMCYMCCVLRRPPRPVGPPASVLDVVVHQPHSDAELPAC